MSGNSNQKISVIPGPKESFLSEPTPAKLHKQEEADQPGETSCKSRNAGLAGVHGSSGSLNHAN